MTTIDVEAPSRRPLILVQVTYVAFVPVWFALSIGATMGLANTPQWWAAPALLAVWAYPLVALVGATLAHVLHGTSPRAARWWNLLPMPWLLAGGALLLWILADSA